MSRAGWRTMGPALVVALAACAPAGPSPSPTDTPAPTTDAPSPTSLVGDSTPAPSRSPGGELPAGWEQLPPAPFSRLEMAVAAHDGRIWLAGGLSPLGEAITDVDVFDPSTGDWHDGPSLPAAVHHAALVSDGERLLLIGGYLGSTFNRPTDIVLELTDGDSEWRAGPILPAARGAGAAAWDGARVVYAGGTGAGGVAAEIFALVDDGWEAIGAMSHPREHLGATSDGEGRVWLLGGRVGGLDTNVTTVDLVEGGSVSPLPPIPTARGGVAAFFSEEFGACLTGGEAPDRAFATVECIDRTGATITLPELVEPHHGHGAAVVDGTVYVLLGGPRPALSAGATIEALALDEAGR